MIEAAIVYPLVWALLAFLLSFMILTYQGWYVQVVANEAATLIGETAKFSTSDYDEFYIRAMEVDSTISKGVLSDDLKKLMEMRTKAPLFRYPQNKSTWQSAITARVKDYVNDQLSSPTFLIVPIEPEKTKVEYVDDGFGRAHINVTVTGDYWMMFGEVLPLFNIDSDLDVLCTGRADLLDVSDYLTTTHMVISADDVRYGVGVDTGSLGGATSRASNLRKKVQA